MTLHYRPSVYFPTAACGRPLREWTVDFNRVECLACAGTEGFKVAPAEVFAKGEK